MRRVTSTPVTVSWGDGTSAVRTTRCRAAAAGADLDRCTLTLTRAYAAPGRYRVTVRQGTRVLASRVVRIEAAVSAQPGVVTTLDTVEPTGPSRSPDVVPQPWQAQMLERVNAQRARVGAGPVMLCARLMTAAQRHTDDMHARLYYDHVTPEGLSPRARAEREGYLGRVGENLSLNPLGGLDLVDDVWANSPGHYANMINPEWTHLGVGYTEDEYNAFFAQEFGVGGVC